jgi:hypothetical protein
VVGFPVGAGAEGFGATVGDGFAPAVADGFAPGVLDGFAPGVADGFAAGVADGFAAAPLADGEASGPGVALALALALGDGVAVGDGVGVAVTAGRGGGGRYAMAGVPMTTPVAAFLNTGSGAATIPSATARAATACGAAMRSTDCVSACTWSP